MDAPREFAFYEGKRATVYGTDTSYLVQLSKPCAILFARTASTV
jgi:hypothetical protein